jgi:hypothetical protein
MLYDGINLTSGSSVFNLEIENVATLPAAVADGLGRMVYLTSAYSTYSVGPYVNDGTIWQPIQTSASAGVSTAGDSYFNSVSLLMHAEGTNGSSSFVDSSATPKTDAGDFILFTYDKSNLLTLILFKRMPILWIVIDSIKHKFSFQ